MSTVPEISWRSIWEAARAGHQRHFEQRRLPIDATEEADHAEVLAAGKVMAEDGAVVAGFWKACLRRTR